MKNGSTRFLQFVIILIGIGALTFLLWEPHLEGRNVNATLFAIYFQDPFLAYAYIASIPFFVALYQAFTVLGYVGQKRIFSQEAIHALRTIQLCAIAIIGFVALGEVFILLGNSDDRPQAIMMGIIITFGSTVVAVTAAMFGSIVEQAIERKSETIA